MSMIKNEKIEKMKKVLISIKGLPGFTDNDDHAVEMMTDGEYLKTDDRSTLRYYEHMLADGNEADKLTVFDFEPDRIVLHRGRDTAGDMIFSENQKHHFFYDTPQGSVLMGIDTTSIKKNMNDDGGNIEIRYDVEIDNIAISRNTFKIDIRSIPQ